MILRSMPTAERQNTSPERQLATRAWAVLSRHQPPGTEVPVHQHTRGQLVYAVRGVMQVQAASTRWAIPSQRALWLPPGQPHSIRMLSATELRTVYFTPELLALCSPFARQAEVHALHASPLLRELVLCLCSGHAAVQAQQLIASLLLHVLQEAQRLPTDLPMPANAQLRRAASLVLAFPQARHSLADLADVAAMSERSFTRRFSAEAGMSFRAWQQRARILGSLDLLAAGRETKAIARATGFTSSASYASAFRQLLGCSPSQFRA